jgi:hypothetical protein
MAKITINADTENDDLEVSIDGNVISDVSSVSFYLCPCWNDPTEMELNVCINTYVHDKQSGLKTSVSLTASDTEEGNKLIRSGAKLDKKFKDFVNTIATNQAKLDIAKYFERGI